MTDPIQRDASAADWIRNNKREALRRLVVWGALLGVLLYIYGEISQSEAITLAGIWIIVGSLAAAILYKVVSFISGFFGN